MKVTGTTYVEVEIDPLDVVEKLKIIPDALDSEDWIVKKDKKYIHMTEGYRNFDRKVGEVSKEVYDAYEAQQLLIKYLRKLDK